MSDDENTEAEDPWADALNEQAESEAAAAAAPTASLMS